MSFCQRTVTPGKPAEIVCWLCTACRNVYRHFNSIIPVNSPEQFEARIPEDTSCLCLRPHVPSLTSPLSIRQSPICRFLNIKVSYRFFFCTPYMTHGCAKKKTRDIDCTSQTWLQSWHRAWSLSIPLSAYHQDKENNFSYNGISQAYQTITF